MLEGFGWDHIPILYDTLSYGESECLWHLCWLCVFEVTSNWVNTILSEINFTQDCKGTMCIKYANRVNALGHEIVHPVSLPVPLPEGVSLDLDWLGLQL